MTSHWNSERDRGMGRGISTRLQSDRPGPSDSGKTADNWMSQKRIDRHFRINGGKTKLTIKQGDITRTKVDAIVNAANEHMTGGAGVDGIIHRAAGGRLREECYLHRQVEPGVRLPTGRSRILLSYNLSSNTSYIINTAGPVYDSYEKERCAEELESCYKTALALANLYDLTSIAFPAISCGIFGYPADKGAEAALKMSDQHANQLSEVMFILFDDHIYDAWIKKVTELNYPAFESTKSLVKPEDPETDQKDDDDKDVVSTQPTGATGTATASSSFHCDVTDVSSDTQRTVDMDDAEDPSPPKDTKLEKHTTVEMADVHSQAQETEGKDNSQSQLTDSPSTAAAAAAAEPTTNAAPS